MDPNVSTRSPLPPASIVIPAILFFALSYLASPPWHGIHGTVTGCFLLTISLSLPLVVLAAPNCPQGIWLFASMCIASAAAVFLCFHAGISALVVNDLDAGLLMGRGTVVAALGVFIGALAVPIGLIIPQKLLRARLSTFIIVPALLGALGQLLFFFALRMWEGATGIGLWMESRIAIHGVFGLVAGLFVGSAKLFRPKIDFPLWGGFTNIAAGRLPNARVLLVVLFLGLFLFGSLRVVIELKDKTRFIDTRLDEYFLALSNLRRAQLESLEYPELRWELERAGRALKGSASYDPSLRKLISTLIESIEHVGEPKKDDKFQDVTMKLNRQLLALGEPFFLEPQVIVKHPLPFRFLLRYKVTGQARYRDQGGGSVPILRLRRIDQSLIDTPYTGLSYTGMGTVLMDHIDEVSLKSYGTLFSPKASEANPKDGRFTSTRRLMRLDQIGGMEEALGKRGYTNRSALERLAQTGANWAQVADISGVREVMDPVVRANFDALTEVMARQTEVHEARHAFDGEWMGTLERLDELSAGKLGPSAASEIRAYLTEIVDGPFGPHFALAKAAKMVAGPGARSNAYFFAGVVLLETLWGERIRRPDILKREGEEGPTHVFAHITQETPGWLSYSRIHGAYDDLRKLPPEELKTRARNAFEELFKEEYRQISRQR